MTTEQGAPLWRAFGTVLKRYRVAAGLTQEALAERAGLSIRGISDLERGANRVPRSDTLALLAAALGLVGPARVDFEAAARGVANTTLAAGTGQASGGAVTTPLVGRTQELAWLEE